MRFLSHYGQSFYSFDFETELNKQVELKSYDTIEFSTVQLTPTFGESVLIISVRERSRDGRLLSNIDAFAGGGGQSKRRARRLQDRDNGIGSINHRNRTNLRDILSRCDRFSRLDGDFTLPTSVQHGRGIKPRTRSLRRSTVEGLTNCFVFQFFNFSLGDA